MFARFHTTIDNRLAAKSSATICSISLILLIVLGWLDYITGDYSLIIFYLIPVALVAWFVGKKSGLLFCVLSLITRIIADEVVTSFAFQFSALHYWNVVVEFVFLLIMSLLFSALKKSMAKGPQACPLPDHVQNRDKSP